MNGAKQYSLVEASSQKWLENGSVPNVDEYELFISKYDANQDQLIEQKGETLEEEEEGVVLEETKEPKTPSQSAYEEGEDLESSNKECCESNNKISVKSRH